MDLSLLSFLSRIHYEVLLNNPALSIAEIAVRCKFPDSSYMSRFFKKNTGISFH